MTEHSTNTAPETSSAESRAQHLQRRVLRLLLQHDETLFHRQFHLFFVTSTLPPMPLLQQYDRFIKLRTLSGELLNDLMPRIRRELSLKTNHSRLHEEAPTRGDIDWMRSLERSLSQQPGLPPLQFETRLRQRTLDTPENVLVVALLLTLRREVQTTLREQFKDEELSQSERQTLVSAEEQIERELATAYARTLTEQATHADLPTLVAQVTTHLRPGAGPYRDLLHWWQRFQGFRVGRATGTHATALTSTRTDEKTNAWLYELWIVLELLHLLHQSAAIQSHEVEVITDALQCTFTWQNRRFRLHYNRQLNTTGSYQPDWQHGPPTRPDYTIERAEPDLLEIRHADQLIWREPPVILDAKYYLEGSDPANTHAPIKKMLGDMNLLDIHYGALFFPLLPEPPAGQTITRTLRRTGKQYGQNQTRQIHLFHLEPQMPLETLQTRLRAVLDFAAEQLPVRPAPVCRGMMLDSDTVNADNHPIGTLTALCPKPHIGPGVFDLVNVETDCLKNPRLCHVIGEPIVPPFIVRVITQEELERQCQTLRTRGNELLQAAEQAGDEVRAERIRTHIFTGIGLAVEQYVRLFGSTTQIENKFDWAFGPYWREDPHCLAENTRNSLVSGEHIWENYSTANVLQDWAAPAIQYCRTLEYELKRRLYDPSRHAYSFVGSHNFTLGAITHAYDYRNSNPRDRATWQTMLSRLPPKDHDAFARIVERMSNENLHTRRNKLAHGEAISKETAASLREIVIGTRQQPGILFWLAEHINTT